MFRHFALSNLLTVTLCGVLPGCNYLRSLQHESGLSSFRIKEIEVDPDSGELQVNWSRASGTDYYRAWISRSGNCHDNSAGISVEGKTSLRFSRGGPGSYVACVEAVPNPEGFSSNTCNSEMSTINGTGYAAKNQGKEFSIAPQRGGSWRKFADADLATTLLGNQGGILVQSNDELLVFDDEGQLLMKAKALTSNLSPLPFHYVHANGQLLALDGANSVLKLLQWDAVVGGWTRINQFPDMMVLGSYLVSPHEWIIVLKDKDTTRAQWLTVDPAALGTIRTTSNVSLTSQTGLAFFNYASIYVEGSFIIADNRGFHRLTPNEIITLTSNTMIPKRLYHFPGAEQEFMVSTQYTYLQSPAVQLICSPAPSYPATWFGWNSASGKLTKIDTGYGESFTHAIAEGPVAVSSLLGGSFLELKAERPTFFPAPPFPIARILDGPQLPQNRLLVANGKELWLFTPEGS